MTHIPFKISLLRLVFLLLPVTVAAQEARLSDYVDPKIGSEGLGRVFIGPSCPYGMVKPSPDCTVHPNSGWLPMPEQVNGFSQVHVSGTGGGPKYGNILVMPFGKGMDQLNHIDYRKDETIRLGYYATEFQRTGTVSYTHLDVYKRQIISIPLFMPAFQETHTWTGPVIFRLQSQSAIKQFLTWVERMKTMPNKKP